MTTTTESTGLSQQQGVDRVLSQLVERQTNAAGTTVTFLDSELTKSTNRVILLVPGTGGSAASHYGTIQPLLSDKQRVVAMNWGDPATDHLSSDDLVAQVESVIEAIGSGVELTLVGYSLGSAIAALTAARNPERVANLILVCGWTKPDRQLGLRNSIMRQLIAEQSSAAARFWAFSAFSSEFLELLSPAQLEGMIATFGFDSLTRRQMELNATIDIEDEAATISCPTLVIGCTEDLMLPMKHSKILWAAIPDARLATVHSGHGIVIERPAQLCALVQDFVEHPQKHPAGTQIVEDRY